MTGVLPDPVDETRRILSSAERAGLELRALGGIGIALRAPSIHLFRPLRTYHDIDLAGAGPRGRVETLLVDLGYLPARQFNALNAAERLLFHDPSGRRIDVFLDLLRMCHTLRFRDRLPRDRLTLPLADLLLAKLQIVELTDRDAQDVAALLADHELTDDDAGIGMNRIVSVCRADWGWWRTVEWNLARLITRWPADAAAASEDAAVAIGTATARASRLRAVLAATPKSASWRARAILGDRVRWYEEPEEIR